MYVLAAVICYNTFVILTLPILYSRCRSFFVIEAIELVCVHARACVCAHAGGGVSYQECMGTAKAKMAAKR